MPTLQELRLRRLWSQRELAKQAGVAEGTIVAAEAGRRPPRLLTMRRIAEALGVDWTEIAEFRATVDAAVEKKAAASSDRGGVARGEISTVAHRR